MDPPCGEAEAVIDLDKNSFGGESGVTVLLAEVEREQEEARG